MSTHSTFIEGLVLDLVRLGWTSAHHPPFAGIARREFETAVGLRSATLYARQSNDSGDRLVIWGDYISQGRNALSTLLSSIGASSDDHDRIAFAAHLNAEVVAAVNQTYARRLLVEHGLSQRSELTR